MVAPGNSKRDVAGYRRFKCFVQSFCCGFGKDQVAGINDQVRFFCVQHFVHAFGSFFRSRIPGYPVYICKLDDLKFFIAVEFQRLCLHAKYSHAEKCGSHDYLFHRFLFLY